MGACPVDSGGVRDAHECRPDQMIAQSVSLLEDGRDGALIDVVALFPHHRLVLIWVESFAIRADVL